MSDERSYEQRKTDFDPWMGAEEFLDVAADRSAVLVCEPYLEQHQVQQDGDEAVHEHECSPGFPHYFAFAGGGGGAWPSQLPSKRQSAPAKNAVLIGEASFPHRTYSVTG